MDGEGRKMLNFLVYGQKTRYANNLCRISHHMACLRVPTALFGPLEVVPQIFFCVFTGVIFFYCLFSHVFAPPAKEEKEPMKSTRGSRLGSDWNIAENWKFPETSAEKKSMAVFEDLWARGMCAVSGSNYGADYVIYDGENEWGFDKRWIKYAGGLESEKKLRARIKVDTKLPSLHCRCHWRWHAFGVHKKGPSFSPGSSVHSRGRSACFAPVRR